MSSETQVDLDWAATDVAEGAAASGNTLDGGAGAGARDAASSGAAYLTDEEILGIEPAGGGDLRRDSSGKGGPQNDRQFDSDREDAARGEGAALGHKGRQAEARPTEGGAGAPAMPAWMMAAAADPKNADEACALWSEHQEFRAAFGSAAEAKTFVQEARAVADEARAIKELLPGGVKDIVSLREATQSVERIDAALFSGDARAQADVVSEMARVNPAAFRSMFAEAARVMAGLDGRDERAETQRDSSGKNGPQNDNAIGTAANENQPSRELRANDSRFTNQPSQGLRASQSAATNQPSREGRASESPFGSAQGEPITNHAFDAAAYAAFERSTNETVARDVRGSITDTLARVMPEGVAEGAARRIGEDIFGEVHRALAADRTLSEQVAGVLRGGVAGDPLSPNSGYGGQRGGVRFGAAEQQRVAALVAGRAKQIVPSVARRVIGEWTSSVLNTARSKAARQAAAAARVDIAAPGGSSDSMPLRAMSAREVNYASMSDEQILGM